MREAVRGCEQRGGHATLRPLVRVQKMRSAATEGSQGWIEELRSEGPARDEAIGRLHALLLRAARFEVRRRARSVPHLRGGDLDDVALQSANDALVAVLAKLDRFRGQSRFTTWAYKFALLEAAVKVRRLAWQGREIPLEPAEWPRFADSGSSPSAQAERGELLGENRTGYRDRPHAAPARGARRPGFERGPDRRAGRSARHDARGPLQDPPRRAAQAAPNARPGGGEGAGK